MSNNAPTARKDEQQEEEEEESEREDENGETFFAYKPKPKTAAKRKESVRMTAEVN